MLIHDDSRELVYKAGRREGLTGKVTWPPPLPDGAVLRADWDRGVEDGLREYSEKKRKAK